jgi:hypothetical protein
MYAIRPETGGWDEVVRQMPAFAAHLDVVLLPRTMVHPPRGNTRG